MRFLFILVLVLSLFMAAFSAFVLPREHLNMVLSQMPAAVQSAWNSASQYLPAWADDEPPDGNFAEVNGSDDVIARARGVPVGNWLYQCSESPVQDAACTITHQVAEDGRIKFSWQITVDSAGRMRARWRTLTGVQVNEGIVLETSGQKPLTLPYSKCVAGYCESTADLNPKFIETLLKTELTSATVHDATGEPVTYAINLDGLAASLRLLDDGDDKILSWRQ